MDTKITYFHRNNRAGYSIRKVMKTITSEVSKSMNIEELYVPEYRASLIHILKNILFVYKHRNKDGVNHITGDIHYCMLGLIGCKTVLTIHDIGVYEFANNPIRKFLAKVLWFYIPLIIADEVVCISETTKERLQTIVKKKDIKVIYNATQIDFKYKPKKFNSTNPRILHIGTTTNKNLNLVIAAIKDLQCHLRIIGYLNEKTINKLKKYSINYSNVSDLTDNEIIKEYEDCDIISFCSTYEGFGMPIIEGNATGRIVLTSNLNPMSEIALNAAVLVNPYSITSIKTGIIKIITDSEYRNTIIENGLKNMDRFKLDKTVNSYLNLYENL